MKKLVIACLLVLVSTVVVAGSKEVAPVSSGSASSTFSVGVPHFSAASAVRGAAAPAATTPGAKGGPAAKGKAAAGTKKEGAVATRTKKEGKVADKKSARLR